MLFPEGIKCKNVHPEEIQVSSRGVNYTDFFVFQRGNTPQKQRSSTGGGGWFSNVIAQYDLCRGCPNFNRGLYSVCLVLK
jgi:hypothetical protein